MGWKSLFLFGRDTQGQERIGTTWRGGAVLLPIPLASLGGL